MQLVTAKKNTHFGLAFLVAIVMDALDWAVIGSIPGYGDIFDLIAIGVLYKLIGPVALFGAVEFIPLEDPVPTYTIIVIVAWLYKGSNRALR